MFGHSVYRGPGRRRTIALTFDDGPSPDTLTLARYLQDQGVRATFFQCGTNIVRHPGVSGELLRMGHELGNHTFTHIRMTPRIGWTVNLVSAKKIYQELADTQAVIERDTGARAIWFRAPYGMRWFGLRGAMRKLGLTSVMWTIIAHDWEWSIEEVVAHVLRLLTPGSILCFHDGRDIRSNPDITVTLGAISELVPRLKEIGFGFDTISEILEE